MKVKKYVAATMPEAMKLIRAELGNDAVILNTKNIQSGGFLGFFKKKKIEVIAAIDPKPVQAQKPVIKEKNQSLDSPPISFIPKAEIPKMNEHSPQKGSLEIISELTEIKEMMKNISVNETQTQTPFLPEPLQLIERNLRDQEINSITIDKVIAKLLEMWYLNGANATEHEVRLWARDEISKQISHLSFGGVSFKKKFVNVVGPTGVGKTTTLAKIAAECVLKHNKKVAFITTDTYRIAAIDQLKTYAKILNIPIEVCYNLKDFEEAAKKFSTFDVVLIDTAGRNFRNKQYVEDLKTVIDFNKDMESFLVLALTSKTKDMEDIYNQFSIINIDRFIFTKVDETSIYGSMLSLLDHHNTGVAYLTNGQDVPDDLITASPEKIANTLLGVE